MIRFANQTDLPEIVAIYNESIPGRMVTADLEPITVESRVKWFNEHDAKRPLWVYEKNNEIAGWFRLQNFHERCAYQATVEMSVYIKSSFKRQGIGKQLLSHALATCPKLNINTVLALIFGHNEPSIQLIKNFNFTEWGYLPNVAELDGIERDVVIYGLRTA